MHSSAVRPFRTHEPALYAAPNLDVGQFRLAGSQCSCQRTGPVICCLDLCLHLSGSTELHRTASMSTHGTLRSSKPSPIASHVPAEFCCATTPPNLPSPSRGPTPQLQNSSDPALKNVVRATTQGIHERPGTCVGTSSARVMAVSVNPCRIKYEFTRTLSMHTSAGWGVIERDKTQRVDVSEGAPDPCCDTPTHRCCGLLPSRVANQSLCNFSTAERCPCYNSLAHHHH